MMPYCRLSDHSLLFLDILTMDYDAYYMSGCVSFAERDGKNHAWRSANESSYIGSHKNTEKQIKYKINGIPENFMLSEEVLDRSRELIDSLLEQRLSQERVNQWYDRLQDLLYDEMNKHFKPYEDTPNAHRNACFEMKPW